MRFLMLALISLALVTTGCISVVLGIPGSGVSQTEKRTVDSFDKVVFAGTGDVNIEVGQEASVTVTTDDNLMELIETVVKDGQLTVRQTENINPKVGLTIDITVPTLSEASVSGAGELTVKDVAGESLSLSVSGAGDIQASGEVKNLTIRVSGVGDAQTKDLVAENVTVRVSGTGSASVYASQSLDAQVSGVGGIDCYGNPQDVKKNVSGIGDIDIKN